MRKLLWGLLCILLPAALAGPATAQEDDGGREFFRPRFAILLGGFWPAVDSKIRLDAADGTVGTTIDLESDLGLARDNSLWWGGFRWRIAGKHHLEVDYFELGRDGIADLEGEIRIGDQIFPIGTTVKTTFDSDVFRIGYAYSFISNPKAEFGISAGFHVMDVFFEIHDVDQARHKDAEVTAPLPVIGIHGGYRFSERWAFSGRAQFFGLEFDDYEGDMEAISAAFLWDTTRWFSLGLGIDYYRVNVKSEDADWKGEIKYEYFGPVFAIGFHW